MTFFNLILNASLYTTSLQIQVLINGEKKRLQGGKRYLDKGTRFGFEKTCFSLMNIVVFKVQIRSEVRKGC